MVHLFKVYTVSKKTKKKSMLTDFTVLPDYSCCHVEHVSMHFCSIYIHWGSNLCSGVFCIYLNVPTSRKLK